MATLTSPTVHLPGLTLKFLLTLVLHGTLLYWALQAMPGLVVLSHSAPVPIQAVLIPPPRPAAPPVTPPRPLPSAVPAARPAARPMPPSTPKPAPAALLTTDSGAAAMASAPATPAAAEPSPVAAAPHSAVAAPPALEPARFDADYLNNPAPPYPLFSRRNREEGTVLLSVRVSAQGQAEQVQIKRSSGFTRLDEAALEAVRQWRFVPAQRGQVAVAASVVVPIVFKLAS